MPTVVFRAEKTESEEELRSSYSNADLIDAPPNPDGVYAPVTVAGYIFLFLAFLLPGVNIVVLIVLASGGTKKLSVINFARAALIVLFFAVVLFLILWIARGSFWTGFLDYFRRYW